MSASASIERRGEAVRPTRRWLGVVIAATLAGSCTANAASVIDPYLYDYTGSECSGGERPGATALLQWLMDHDGVGLSGGIYGCRPISGTSLLSLHAEGRAVDWVLDNRDPRQRKVADGIVAALLKRRHGHSHALARRMGIQEIIWNCGIWRADRPDDGLAPYQPCSTSTSRTARHENHVHVGLSRDGAEERTGFWASGPWPQDLLAVRNAGSKNARARVLDGATLYTSSVGPPGGRHGTSKRTLAFLYGDYDNDWVDDLFAIGSTARSRRLGIIIYSGASGFRSRLLTATTPLSAASLSRFGFGLGDYDHDGRLDVYAIQDRGAASTTVHVLSGADGYRWLLGSISTPLPGASGSRSQYAVGDRDNDGFDDIYAITHRGGRATQVSILGGATNFGSLQDSVTTALRRNATRGVRFVVGDYDDDGHEDVYGVTAEGGARTTRVDVFRGPTFASSGRGTKPRRRRTGGRSAFALPAQPGL